MKNRMFGGVGVMGLAFTVAISAGLVHAAEFGDNTPYYEDDGLLDVSEWFDGNDYNPTDEAWWRWDDETYQASKDTGGDRDNDLSYGYNTGNENDFYYDYYDPYPYSFYHSGNIGLYGYGSRYHDYDNDGFYDAYTSYSDWDHDGLYEDYGYYSFTDTSTDKQKKQAKDQVTKESKPQTVTGKIEKTKMVKVRGGKQHVVVAIKPESGPEGKMLIVDLGNADNLKDANPKVGEMITAKGPKAIVGKQGVVLARSVEINGKMIEIDRNPRSITGKVLSTHKTVVRGNQHLMAMVETGQKDKKQKIAVDLGRADRMKTDIKKDTNLTFSGFPVKVMVKGMDRPLMVAESVTQDNKVVQINRQPSNPADAAQPVAGKQPAEKTGTGK